MERCCKEYRTRDGRWTQCRRRAVKTVWSKNLVILYYCAKHSL